MCFVVWFSHRDDEGVASAEEVLQGLSLNPSMEDCIATRRVCQIVSTRAAHLCAAALVAVLRQIRDNKAAEKLRATIGVDGSVYKNHQEYVFFWALTVLFCVTTVQGHSWWLTWPGKLLLQSRTHWILFFNSFRKNFSSLAQKKTALYLFEQTEGRCDQSERVSTERFSQFSWWDHWAKAVTTKTLRPCLK